MRAINPDISVVGHDERLDHAATPPTVDVVMDCLDNFKSRFQLDDLFFKKGIPIIHGGASEYFGQATTLVPGRTGGVRALFGTDFFNDEDRSPRDVFPPVVTAVASCQVSEAVKLVSGNYDALLIGKILAVDLLTNSFDVIEIKWG